jgi:hypothetical protein
MLSARLQKKSKKDGKTEMTRFKFLASAALAVLSLAIFAQPAQAQQPQYLHALSNLRMARAWLKAMDGNPSFSDRRHETIEEINHAIDEIKKACRDDGKNDSWTPPPQSPARPDPYITAYHLLIDAHNNVSAGVDQPQSMGQQAKALHHIDQARDNVHEIVDRAHGRP